MTVLASSRSLARDCSLASRPPAPAPADAAVPVLLLLLLLAPVGVPLLPTACCCEDAAAAVGVEELLGGADWVSEDGRGIEGLRLLLVADAFGDVALTLAFAAVVAVYCPGLRLRAVLLREGPGRGEGLRREVEPRTTKDSSRLRGGRAPGRSASCHASIEQNRCMLGIELHLVVVCCRLAQ